MPSRSRQRFLASLAKCPKKMRHETAEQAQRIAAQRRGDGSDPRTRWVHFYRCPRCHYWHLGRNKAGVLYEREWGAARARARKQKIYELRLDQMRKSGTLLEDLRTANADEFLRFVDEQHSSCCGARTRPEYKGGEITIYYCRKCGGPAQ